MNLRVSWKKCLSRCACLSHSRTLFPIMLLHTVNMPILIPTQFSATLIRKCTLWCKSNKRRLEKRIWLCNTLPPTMQFIYLFSVVLIWDKHFDSEPVFQRVAALLASTKSMDRWVALEINHRKAACFAFMTMYHIDVIAVLLCCSVWDNPRLERELHGMCRFQRIRMYRKALS